MNGGPVLNFIYSATLPLAPAVFMSATLKLDSLSVCTEHSAMGMDVCGWLVIGAKRLLYKSSQSKAVDCF